MRLKGRDNQQIRPIIITSPFLNHAHGSALIELGNTKVLCAATIEAKVPQFLKGSKQGWVTAEYAMLPCSAGSRISRERQSVNARSLEIQRLIGRSLRAVTDMGAFGERTVTIDCDVIQADGGTRTAAISGAFIALAKAFMVLYQEESLEKYPLYDYLSAVSVGIVDGNYLLDLDFSEDSKAEVDLNIVMSSCEKLVEIQGTAEQCLFGRDDLDKMLDLASEGIRAITLYQKTITGEDINSLIDKTVII